MAAGAVADSNARSTPPLLSLCVFLCAHACVYLSLSRGVCVCVCVCVCVFLCLFLCLCLCLCLCLSLSLDLCHCRLLARSRRNSASICFGHSTVLLPRGFGAAAQVIEADSDNMVSDRVQV